MDVVNSLAEAVFKDLLLITFGREMDVLIDEGERPTFVSVSESCHYYGTCYMHVSKSSPHFQPLLTDGSSDLSAIQLCLK